MKLATMSAPLVPLLHSAQAANSNPLGRRRSLNIANGGICSTVSGAALQNAQRTSACKMAVRFRLLFLASPMAAGVYQWKQHDKPSSKKGRGQWPR